MIKMKNSDVPVNVEVLERTFPPSVAVISVGPVEPLQGLRRARVVVV